MPKNQFKFYDNGGESFDRYTLVDLSYTFTRRGKGNESYVNYVGSSAMPNSPQGFWQHGEIRLKDVRVSVLGKKVLFKDLPEEVKNQFLAENKGYPTN